MAEQTIEQVKSERVGQIPFELSCSVLIFFVLLRYPPSFRVGCSPYWPLFAGIDLGDNRKRWWWVVLIALLEKALDGDDE
jgi:hypothetical protein